MAVIARLYGLSEETINSEKKENTVAIIYAYMSIL